MPQNTLYHTEWHADTYRIAVGARLFLCKLPSAGSTSIRSQSKVCTAAQIRKFAGKQGVCIRRYCLVPRHHKHLAPFLYAAVEPLLMIPLVADPLVLCTGVRLVVTGALAALPATQPLSAVPAAAPAAQ